MALKRRGDTGQKVSHSGYLVSKTGLNAETAGRRKKKPEKTAITIEQKRGVSEGRSPRPSRQVVEGRCPPGWRTAVKKKS